KGGRLRPEPQPERTRGRLSPAPDDPALTAPRLLAGHLLLEDGRDQRLEDRARPPEADAAIPAIQLRHERMVPGLEAGSIVVEAAQGRQTGENPIRARSPRLRLQPRAGGRDPDGRR